MKKMIIGITGGSATLYAVALLQALKQLEIEMHLVMSLMGEQVLRHECGYTKEAIAEFADFFYESNDLFAPIASGTFRTDGMVIVPCSMKTLGGIASGYSDNLVTRCADVALKEGRKLVLVPRETPLNAIHLENMLKLSRLGVVIMPASPGFYHQPKTISELVDGMICKILDQFGIEHQISKRWGEKS